MSLEISDVERLVLLAKKVNLLNNVILDNYAVSDLSEIYNGIGSESFPEWLRLALSTLHPSLEVVALIHDVEWENSNGTYESFTMSNERFRENGIIMQKYNYSWYDPRRYIVMYNANKFQKLCQNFGFETWKSNVRQEGEDV